MLQQFRGTDQYRERVARVCFVKVISVGLTIAEGRGQLFAFRFVKLLQSEYICAVTGRNKICHHLFQQLHF